MADKVFNEKYYRNTWSGKSWFRWIALSLYNCFFPFLLSFFLLEVKFQIIKLDFSQNWYQLTYVNTEG